MNKLIYILSLFIAFAACESMEDTYSEYNTPKERYVGMCSDLKIELGWKRFRLSWKNNVDAAIENIKVKWENEKGVADSVVLSADAEEYNTESVFSNQSYKFIVTAIDNRNKESFPVEVYGKPYTEESSVIEMLKVVEKKFYFVGDQLILMLYDAGKDMYDSKISYTSGGEKKVQKIEREDFEKGRLIIESIDANTDVSISGKMKIAECIDEIPLDKYVLDRNKKSWSGAFIGNMREQFDMLEVTDEQLDTLTTLYVDYNISSLEDILYLPNLQKVVLGKKRMNSSSYNISGASYVSKIEDIDASVFALRKMHELKGIEVDIYGNQFLIKDSLDFENLYTQNTPPLPSVPNDIENWELTIDDPVYYENDDPEDNHLYLLEDMLGNTRNDWQSIQSSEIKTHEITYDMKELKEVTGFQFYQSNSRLAKIYLPETIQIHVSVDGMTWETAFYQATLNVGGVRGEVTIAKMREPKTVRYVKLIVRDVETTKNNCVAIGDFIPLI